jgi:HlyD family secretion protein
VVAARPERRSRRTRSPWLGRALGLVVVGALAALMPRLVAKKPVVVGTVRVERGTVRDVVSSSTAGEIVPRKHATVRAELAARVVTVKHERGERVRRGEAVVLLDAADLEARVEQAQATLRAQEAQRAQAEVRAQAAARAAERARALAQKGAGTSQLSDDTAAEEHAAREAARAAEGMIAQAQAALRVSRVARGRAEIAAPFDGLLIDVTPDPGDELSPGAPVFEIIDDSRLRVEASVEEADATRVRVGQPATLTLDALPGRPIAGVLAEVGPAVRKDLKGARTLPIEVEVADVKAATAAGLRSGMSADVEIIVAQKADTVSLPTNVIIGRGAKRTVFVVDEGRARTRTVEVGLSNWDRSEILSGVKLGDEVVATLNMKELEDGVRVKVGP